MSYKLNLKSNLSILILISFFTLTSNAQEIVTIPECTNCGNDGGGGNLNISNTACGPFPHKIKQMDVTVQGLLGFITEAGNVFFYGTNNAGLNFPYNQTSGTFPLTIETPVRVEMPGNVKAKKIVLGHTNNLVIGEDNLLYAYGGLTQRTQVNTTNVRYNPFGGATNVNETSFTQISLPAGVNYVKDVEVWDRWDLYSTVIIGDNGKAYLSGRDAKYKGYNTWTEIPQPSASITYEKVWSAHFEAIDEESPGAYFFKMSDGNYYAWGSNVDNALGSNFAHANNSNHPNSVQGSGNNSAPFFYVSEITDAPLKMDNLDGLDIKEITFHQDNRSVYGSANGNDSIMGQGQAVTTDGDVYVWGFGSLVNPVPTKLNPNLPTRSSFSINPTQAINANYLGLVTDDFSFIPNRSGFSSRDDIEAQKFFPITDDGYYRVDPRLCNNIIDADLALDKSMQFVLTEDGQIYSYVVDTRSSFATNNHTYPMPLVYGYLDAYNPRPTE